MRGNLQRAHLGYRRSPFSIDKIPSPDIYLCRTLSRSPS